MTNLQATLLTFILNSKTQYRTRMFATCRSVYLALALDLKVKAETLSLCLEKVMGWIRANKLKSHNRDSVGGI